MNTHDLTQAVKKVALQNGAALVGVASMDRFDPMPPYYDKVPRGMHPRDFLPSAMSVISFAQPILNPAMDAPALLHERHLEMYPDDARDHWLDSFYQKVAHANQDSFLLAIGQMIGQFLLGKGYDAMVFPTEGIHFSLKDRTEDDLMRNSKFGYISGPISHRHCATRAGLGEFGYNNLLLTREYGSRVRLNTVVTDAVLEADPLVTEPICLRDQCMLCMKACYMNAFVMRDNPGEPDYRSVDHVDKSVIFIDSPVKTFPQRCRDRKLQGGDTYPARGECVRVCPIPRRPKFLDARLTRLYDTWLPEHRARLAAQESEAKDG